jgi:hypothetical protein
VLDLNGTVGGTGYDILAVSNPSAGAGTVSLGNALLFLRQATALPLGVSLTIVDNDGTDAVVGTFLNLPQGSLVSSDLNHFTITYTGGTGNDIVLTTVAGPEIHMTQNGLPKLDGSSLSLPSTKVGSGTSLSFVINNTGTATLTLSGIPRVQITGTDASQFTVVTQPAASVVIGGSTTFVVKFQPTSGGPKTASLLIPNNDSDEGPLNLTLQATALPNPQVTSFTATPPRSGISGTINLSFTGGTPNTTMRLEASSNLLSWTSLRTFLSDSFGGGNTGSVIDPGNTNTPPRRFYRLAQ